MQNGEQRTHWWGFKHRPRGRPQQEAPLVWFGRFFTFLFKWCWYFANILPIYHCIPNIFGHIYAEKNKPLKATLYCNSNPFMLGLNHPSLKSLWKHVVAIEKCCCDCFALLTSKSDWKRTVSVSSLCCTFRSFITTWWAVFHANYRKPQQSAND